MPEGYPTYFNRGALVMHTVGKMTNNALFFWEFLPHKNFDDDKPYIVSYCVK